MQTPSLSTKDHKSDATSQHSQDDTLDPTVSSGNNSERKTKGSQGEDETAKLAELVKVILETVWENSSPDMKQRSQVFKAHRPDEDNMGLDDPWRWRFDDKYDEYTQYSRFDRILLGGNVTLEGFGRPEADQIERLVKIVSPVGQTKRQAELGGHQMTFAGCPVRLNECSVERLTTSVRIQVWFEYAPQ